MLRIRDRSDAEAWRAFDAIYRPMLMRFARSRGLSEADAEDVVQHCLAAVQGAIEGFSYDPVKGRFKGWLRTLVNNRIRNIARKRGEVSAGSAVFAGVAGREGSPEEEFERIWAEEHLWFCMREVEAEVGERTFAAFRLYAVEGRPIEDVCESLGMTVGNVYTIKWRLTDRIAEKMRRLEGEEEA